MRKKSNPEEYKKHRREKGRIAQRAFRQRQIDTINTLEEEVSLLRDSVRKICQAAVNQPSLTGGDNSLPLSSLPLQTSQRMVESELLKAIRHAGQVAGIDEEESSSMTDEHDSGSSQNYLSEPISDTVEIQAPTDDLALGTEGWLLPSASSSSADNIPLQPEELEYLVDPIHNDISTALPQESRYSSSLDTGLAPYKFDPLVPPYSFLSEPKHLKPKVYPFHILPYMDRDADTFAGRIFWKSLSLAFQYGTASLVSPPTTPPKSNHHTEKGMPKDEDERFAHASEMISRSSAHIGKETMLRRIGARLEYLRTGSLDPDSPLWDMNTSMQLRILVEEDAQRRGEKMSDWLRIPDIVDYISSRCGVSSFAQLDVLGTASADESGRGASPRGGLVTKLIEDIAWNGTCFGDGPRYRAREVKEVIDSWVNTLTW
ncbi:predicted protein [Paecilomyces variotii No. 5]|uniref:BZIP domain-containing protein n=1 Tax=Byssochlamys spectabilis (strain No. 5 / NBRC 109023) TaxID=1356009 RepID=V5I1N8_BYSSN|nr:predicted protein [Paecilomyces variotii No. 5]